MYGSIVGHIVRRGVHHCTGGNHSQAEIKAKLEALGLAKLWEHGHQRHHGQHGHHGHHGQDMASQHHEAIAAGKHHQFPNIDVLDKLKTPQAIFTIATTILALLIADFIISYTIGTVITNLTVAEDAQPAGSIKLPLESGDEDKKSLMEVPLPNEFAPTQPITASIRKTLGHIKSVAGKSSLIRGLQYALFYKGVYGLFSSVLMAPGALRFSFLYRLLALVLTTAVTANLHAAWTHATVAAPSEGTKVGFFRRFMPKPVAKHFILPSLRFMLAIQSTNVLARTSTHMTMRLVHHHGLSPLTAASGLIPLVLAVFGFFGLIVPSYIALVRTELSLMPETMPAIVPFDKTFGGKVGWEFAGRREYVFRNLSMRGAYKTFDGAAYRRVLKVVAKTAALKMVLYSAAVVMLSAEFYVFAGKEAKAWVAEYKAQSRF